VIDLRSALVNNDNFAQVAVKHNLHQFLQHSSGFLQDQITEYVSSLESHPWTEPAFYLVDYLGGQKYVFSSTLYANACEIPDPMSDMCFVL
jgi:dsRNA-specific ribonuclease